MHRYYRGEKPVQQYRQREYDYDCTDGYAIKNNPRYEPVAENIIQRNYIPVKVEEPKRYLLFDGTTYPHYREVKTPLRSWLWLMLGFIAYLAGVAFFYDEEVCQIIDWFYAW